MDGVNNVLSFPGPRRQVGLKVRALRPRRRRTFSPATSTFGPIRRMLVRLENSLALYAGCVFAASATPLICSLLGKQGFRRRRHAQSQRRPGGCQNALGPILIFFPHACLLSTFGPATAHRTTLFRKSNNRPPTVSTLRTHLVSLARTPSADQSHEFEPPSPPSSLASNCRTYMASTLLRDTPTSVFSGMAPLARSPRPAFSTRPARRIHGAPPPRRSPASAPEKLPKPLLRAAALEGPATPPKFSCRESAPSPSPGKNWMRNRPPPPPPKQVFSNLAAGVWRSHLHFRRRANGLGQFPFQQTAPPGPAPWSLYRPQRMVPARHLSLNL